MKEKTPDPPGRRPFKERLISDRTDVLEHYAEDILVQQAYELVEKLKIKRPDMTLHIKDGSFKVTDYYDESLDNDTIAGEKKSKQNIATVYNSGPVYAISEKLKRIKRTGKLCNQFSSNERLVMQGVNLYLEPGKIYLVLGAPRSGKSTLLKMIAGIIQEDRDHEVGGTVSLNTFNTKSDDVIWSNYVGYVDQIDRLHPYLTVKETCEFAWKCRAGGTHRHPLVGEGPEIDAEIKRMDEGLYIVSLILEGTGLTRVADTFVGDQQTVRGVSGGEKKRVRRDEFVATAFPGECICCNRFP